MRHETVEEFLARGGQITRCPSQRELAATGGRVQGRVMALRKRQTGWWAMVSGQGGNVSLYSEDWLSRERLKVKRLIEYQIVPVAVGKDKNISFRAVDARPVVEK